jgi:hypothetical protein
MSEKESKITITGQQMRHIKILLAKWEKERHPFDFAEICDVCYQIYRTNKTQFNEKGVAYDFNDIEKAVAELRDKPIREIEYWVTREEKRIKRIIKPLRGVPTFLTRFIWDVLNNIDIKKGFEYAEEPTEEGNVEETGIVEITPDTSYDDMGW